MPEIDATSVLVAALGAAAIIIAAVLGVRTARVSRAATDAKTAVDRELGAGQLALGIANRLDGEVRELQAFRSAVTRWWPSHDAWDDQLERELTRLDPGAAARLPERPHPPL